jgi:acyl CoA:acetate/3-ketoacid CoA transferase beta subunit
VIVTNYAVIEVTENGLVLKEALSGLTPRDVQNMTVAPLIVADDFHEM